MTFGPEPDATLPTVRRAAEQLVADLQGFADQGLVEGALDRCLATLAALNLPGRDNQGPSHELWRIAGPLLELGDLQRRARFKPRGYAGDFEMMTDFWDRRVRGETPLARCFDAYFQKQTAVDAVRARIEWAASLIAERCAASKQDEFRVVSIGSGPGIDLCEAARALPEHVRRRLQLTLLDLDEAALTAARARLESVVAAEQIDARRENLYRLTKLRGRVLPADADFLLCSGLFDYLADDVATDQLRLFWSTLRRGGLLMVGNFAPHCPSRGYMEWIGNWYLIYRTTADLERLAGAAAIPAEARQIAAESTGCDLFLTAEKA